MCTVARFSVYRMRSMRVDKDLEASAPDHSSGALTLLAPRINLSNILTIHVTFCSLFAPFAISHIYEFYLSSYINSRKNVGKLLERNSMRKIYLIKRPCDNHCLSAKFTKGIIRGFQNDHKKPLI